MKEMFFLDTLDLGVSLAIRIPNDFKDMPPNLKHFLFPRYDRSESQKKLKLAGDINRLETLMGFNSSKHEFCDAASITNLQRFSAHIHDKKSLSTVLTTIGTQGNKLVNCLVTVKGASEITSNEVKDAFACQNLHTLGIDVHLGNLLTQCGGDITSSKLVCLELLLNCEMKEDPMGILGELPSLTELIFNRSFLGEEMTCYGSSFPKLRLLKIVRLSDLKQWKLDEGAMPLISELHICDCPNLTVPDGLRHIFTLKKLIVLEMPLWKKDLATRQELSHIRSFIYPYYSILTRSTQIVRSELADNPGLMTNS